MVVSVLHESSAKHLIMRSVAELPLILVPPLQLALAAHLISHGSPDRQFNVSCLQISI